MAPEFSSIMALFTVAAAAGASVRLQAGSAWQVSGNLHIAIPIADDVLAGWMEPLLHPFYDKQTSLLLEYQQANPEILRAELAQAMEEKAEWIHDNPYPEPDHLAHFNAKIANLQHRICPLILFENPRPAHVMPGLSRTPDGALMAVVNEPGAAHTFLSSPAQIRELLCAGYDRKPFVGALLDGSSDQVLPSPELSLLCIVDHTTIFQTITDPDWQDYASRLIVLDTEALHGPQTAHWNVEHSDHGSKWKANLDRILNFRLSGKRMVVPACNEGLAAMSGFNHEVLERLPGLPEANRGFFQRLPDIGWRLSLSLHVMSGLPGSTLPLATLERGISLARWVGEHRLAFFEAKAQEEAASELHKAAAIMLDKILKAGPLSFRELARKYDNQDRTWLGQVLQYLRDQQQVVRDPAGLISVSKDVKTQSGSEALPEGTASTASRTIKQLIA